MHDVSNTAVNYVADDTLLLFHSHFNIFTSIQQANQQAASEAHLPASLVSLTLMLPMPEGTEKLASLAPLKRLKR